MQDYAVIFDYNGVIVDDEPLHYEALRLAVKQYNIDLTQDVYDEICLGRTDSDGLRKLKLRYPDELHEANAKKLTDDKQNAYQHLLGNKNILYPDALQVIGNLYPDFQLAIVTCSTSAELSNTLKRSDLIEKFQVLVTADDITNGKPDPEGYVKALTALKLDSSHAIIIEDTPHGVEAAKNAGVYCIALKHTTPAHKLTQADRIVESLANVSGELIRKSLDIM